VTKTFLAATVMPQWRRLRLEGRNYLEEMLTVMGNRAPPTSATSKPVVMKHTIEFFC
jgi:hypothetical protein